MKTVMVTGAACCLLAGWNIEAQVVPPQIRSPWADSTHVTGVAQKVIPEVPVLPPPVGTDPEPRPPATVQELLDSMSGAELYFRELWDGRSGWGELPAVLRVAVQGTGAEIQSHDRWNNRWNTVCTLTPWNSQCTFTVQYAGTDLVLDISSAAITVSRALCPAGYYGSAQASANYSWEQYRAGSGAFSNRNRYQQPADNGYSGHFFQNGSFQSTCYYEMPG